MQLLDGNKVEQYKIPVTIKAELRKYQQEGVNWLAFLAKYQLHGILCDGESLLRHTDVGSLMAVFTYRYGSRQDPTVNLYSGQQALRASAEVQGDQVTRLEASTIAHRLPAHSHWPLVL